MHSKNDPIETYISRLSEIVNRVELLIATSFKEFDSSQPRDESGKWSETGAGGTGRTSSNITKVRGTQEYKNSIQDVHSFGENTGKEKMLILSSNGMTVNESQGDQDSVIIEDINAIPKGSTIVHNHPTGSSFSSSDIEILVVSDADSIVAISKDYEYTLSKPDGWKVRDMPRISTIKPLWNKHRNASLEPYNQRALRGEDKYIVWGDHTHDVMQRVAEDLGLVYERHKR